MDSLNLDASASMLKGAQDIQRSAVSELFQGGTQAANAVAATADDSLRNDVMQAQGIGQSINTVA